MNSNKEMDTVKNSTDQSKSIRIKNEDYRLLRKYAFENEISLVESISAAIKLLVEKEGK